MVRNKAITVKSGGISIDTTDLRSFATALRRGEKELYKSLHKKLKTAGQIVADDVKERASFSTRIPGSVKVRVSSTSVSVVAGGATAPDAASIENNGKGFVRHPVYGNRQAWTAKNSHPAFLLPALQAKGQDAARAIFSALDDAIAAIVADGGEP